MLAGSFTVDVLRGPMVTPDGVARDVLPPRGAALPRVAPEDGAHALGIVGTGHQIARTARHIIHLEKREPS